MSLELVFSTNLTGHFRDPRQTSGLIQRHIRESKAEKHSRSADLTLAPCPIVELCPARAEGAYLQVRRQRGLLLCALRSAALTEYQSWRIIDVALHYVGISRLKVWCTFC